MLPLISNSLFFQASSEVNCQKYESLLSELLVLDPHHWPAELPQGYGENEVERLCRRFQLNERVIKNAFRDFKENNGRIPDDLAPLINCTRVIPCSTAECERGFSQMNLIITDQRSKILIKHASALMFIKLHGPPLRQWNPSPYVTTCDTIIDPQMTAVHGWQLQFPATPLTLCGSSYS